MQKPSLALFDLDGVLVDTEQLKASAHVAASSSLVRTARKPEDYLEVMGRSQMEVTRHFLRDTHPSDEDLRAYTACFWAEYDRLLRTSLEAMPGARALLNLLHEEGIGIAVVTSSPRSVLTFVLERCGLAALVSFAVCAEDVSNHKPDPEPYLTALRLANVVPDRAIAVEDTDAGVASASRAHLPVVAVRHALNGFHTFKGAVCEIPSLTLLPVLWASRPILDSD